MKAQPILISHPQGHVSGYALHLVDPISFWGGVSPVDGTLTDPTCAHFQQSIAGKVLFIRTLRGSSSGSSVLLELIYRRVAPAAIILDVPDAILALGAVVAREMGWATPALVRLAASDQAKFHDGALVQVSRDGLAVETAPPAL